MGQTILQQWDTAPDYWNQRFVSKEHFEKWFLNNDYFDNEFMKNTMMEFWLSPAFQPPNVERVSPQEVSVDPIDAVVYGFGISGDVPLLAPFGIGGGPHVEFLRHKSGEWGIFAGGGAGLSVGMGANIKVYAATVRNLPTVDDYGGLGLSQDLTASIGPVGMSAGLHQPATGDIGYGETLAWAPGANLSLSAELSNSWRIR